MTPTPAALALFSGGLDSILAMKIVASQGIHVIGLHFCSPFFGHPGKVPYWRAEYGLEIQIVDIHEQFAAMLRSGPPHGFGKALNPCVDCKIAMASRARELLPAYGARFIVSGEVLGQRPMSQRRDALNLITKQAQVRDILLRPLSALHLNPTPMEEEGLVDRSRLHKISGRGRKDQLRLAEVFGIRDIPTPAGGCLLTEKESARRFWPALTRLPHATVKDFELCGIGRQYWHGRQWLAVGRDRRDNEILNSMAAGEDILFKAEGVQGPLALGRPKPEIPWDEADIRLAAAFVARFSEKYRPPGETILVRVQLPGRRQMVNCPPDLRMKSQEAWNDVPWDMVEKEKKVFLK